MKKGSLIVFFVVMFAGVICAGFEVGDLSHDIKTSYAPGSDIQGWANLSFEDQDSSSLFEDNFGNFISLRELLELNKNYDYNCTTLDCESDYVAGISSTTSSFSLGKNNEYLIGFKLDKNIDSFESINFNLESDAGTFCERQIEIDILNDNEIDYGSNTTSAFYCTPSKNYGCFDEEKSLNEYAVGVDPQKHCQRITLPKAPGFRLGADINPYGDSYEIAMALYTKYGESISGGSCVIGDLSENMEYSCDVNYNNLEEDEYYICLYSESSGDAKIYGYPDESEGCGYYGSSPNKEDEAASFKIFAEPIKYESLAGKTIQIGDELQTGRTFANLVLDYLLEKYGQTDCREINCVVPIRIIAGVSQNIDLSNLELKYIEKGLGTTTDNKFYEIEEVPASVNSDYNKLYFDDAEFTLPLDKEDIKFELSFDGTEIFSEEIATEDVPIIKFLRPTSTASAYPTVFEVIVENSSAIKEYVWDFGDNQSDDTKTNKVVHTYNSTGDYNLEITVRDVDNRESVRIFKVEVESPRELINKTLFDYNNRLVDVVEQINSFDEFSRRQLNDFLQIVELGDILKQLQRDYSSADIEEEFNEIIVKLVQLDLPSSISLSGKADNFPYYPSKTIINLDVLAQITDSDYTTTNAEAYRNGILSWHNANIDSKINFRKFDVRYGSEMIKSLSIVEVSLKEKEPQRTNPILIIKSLEDLKFRENYLDDVFGEYHAIDMKGSEMNITFSTSEEFSIDSLPVFVGTDLSQIEISEIGFISEATEDFKWVLFILIILLLLIIGLVIYIVLQEWYKKKYERYLFENQNNLFNLISYIDNSKKKEMSDEEIEVQLGKSGWNSEQIEYAMKKYSGKRTGMFEIPIWNVLSRLKLKSFLKKQPAEVKLQAPPKAFNPQGQFQKPKLKFVKRNSSNI